jgi:hypothetical protein
MSKASKKTWCLKPKQPKKHWGAKVDNVVCTQGKSEKPSIVRTQTKTK